MNGLKSYVINFIENLKAKITFKYSCLSFQVLITVLKVERYRGL